MLFATIGSSAFFFTDKTYVRIILIIIAIGVSSYIFSLRTIKDSDRVLGKAE
jgi:hypothetical protein